MKASKVQFYCMILKNQDIFINKINWNCQPSVSSEKEECFKLFDSHFLFSIFRQA